MSTRRLGGIGALAAGLRAAWEHKRLLFVLWLVLAVLASVGAWPAWRAWSAALEHAPEGDRLLQGFNFALFKELFHYDRSETFGIATSGLRLTLILGLVLNPLLAGGTLAVLAAGRAGRTVAMLLQEGVRFYWRCSRVLLIVGIVAGIVIAALAAALTAIGGAVSDRGLERAVIAFGFLQFVLLAAVAGFFVAVADVARISLVRHDARHALSASWRAARFVLRNLGAFIGIGFGYVVIVCASGAVLLGVALTVPQSNVGWILLAFLLHQMFAWTRVWLRVGVLAGEMALVAAREPQPSEIGTTAAEEPSFPDQPTVEEYSPLR